MANIFFDPGGERAAKVQELFARIAPRYDLINDLQSFGLHRYWKRRVVRPHASRITRPPKQHCGGWTHHVSPPPCFIRGDALRIPFADNSFNIVTVGYGLRNLASWETGLREMQRVAAPGGCLIVLDFGKPDNALWRSLYFGYLKLFVPWLGRIFCGDAGAYAYILESLKHYPAQHAVAAKMRDLGLVNVQTIALLGYAMSINYAEKQSDGVVE